MRYYSENLADFNLQNVLFEAVEVHNNKLHTVTQFKSLELINTKDEDHIKTVLDNIKRFDTKKKKKYYKEIEDGIHVLIKKECIKYNIS